MKNLFNGYNLKVRPAVRPEERVVVRVGMVLSSFVGLVRNFIFIVHRYQVILIRGYPMLQQR